MNQITKGMIAAVLSAMLFGSVGLLVRHIEVNEFVMTFYRLLLGVIFLTIYLIASRRWQTVARSDFSLMIFLSGAMSSVAMVCYMYAINNLSLASAAFLLFLGPIMAVGLAVLFLGERLSAQKAVPLGMAFVGFIFLLEMNFSFESGRGVLWGIGAGLCYALCIIFNRKIPHEVSSTSRAFFQFIVGALVILPFAVVDLLSVSVSDMFWLTGIAFFQGFLALTLVTAAIKYLPVADYGTISYIEPLVAAAVGYIFFAEALSVYQMIGGCLVMAAGIRQVRS